MEEENRQAEEARERMTEMKSPIAYCERIHTHALPKTQRHAPLNTQHSHSHNHTLRSRSPVVASREEYKKNVFLLGDGFRHIFSVFAYGWLDSGYVIMRHSKVRCIFYTFST